MTPIQNRNQMHCCDAMSIHLGGADSPLVYVPKFREYGVRVLDEGTSYVLLEFCPWCGKRLPSSMRDAWFDSIEAMGLEPESQNIPEEYRNDSWWRAREE